MARMKAIYELTAKGEQERFGPQAGLIAEELRGGPKTAQLIAETIKSKLITRQDPLRVVIFYLTKWKKAGIVAVLPELSDEAIETIVKPSNNNTPDATIDEEREQLLGERKESDAPDPAPSPLDFKSMSLRDAVVQVLDTSDANTIDTIIVEFERRGRLVNAKQIKDTVRKLVSRGELSKSGSGTIAAL